MRHAKTYALLAAVMLVAVANSCTHKEQVAVADGSTQTADGSSRKQAMAQHTFTQKGSVTEMAIMPEETAFPDGPGKAEFTSYCGICHSLLYISGQPDFPRATWEAEVHKMVEKYGAPVDSVKGQLIVDYLMMIKGAKS